MCHYWPTFFKYQKSIIHFLTHSRQSTWPFSSHRCIQILCRCYCRLFIFEWWPFSRCRYDTILNAIIAGFTIESWILQKCQIISARWYLIGFIMAWWNRRSTSCVTKLNKIGNTFNDVWMFQCCAKCSLIVIALLEFHISSRELSNNWGKKNA